MKTLDKPNLRPRGLVSTQRSQAGSERRRGCLEHAPCLMGGGGVLPLAPPCDVMMDVAL